ncbi:expressed unknown protein [Seminavis robusta]|uniref:Uncharacterized protein n=1 Tax=Seminavis robusta TaxID=568900 RepID=A0A9N8D4A3_9STRA|nr:expressed unknown protein [Seminavis robusta]|eukprot:Sro1_g000660.1 n/a (183) ;mRNA; f:189722-190270
MNLNGKITSGCTVHLPEAREGDFVLFVTREEWDSLRAVRAPVFLCPKRGRIDFISREKYRQAVVHWYEQSEDHFHLPGAVQYTGTTRAIESKTMTTTRNVWYRNKFFPQVTVFVALAIMAAMKMIEAKGVAYCNDIAAKTKVQKSVLLLAVALLIPLTTLLCHNDALQFGRRKRTKVVKKQT